MINGTDTKKADQGGTRKWLVEIIGWIIAQFISLSAGYLFNAICAMTFNPFDFNPTIRTITAGVYSLFFLFSTWKFFHDNFPKLGV